MSASSAENLIKSLKAKMSERKDLLHLYLANTLYSSMKLMCGECQSDRIRCAFEPMCRDRMYLSLLIESGAKKEELPQLCFRFRLAEIAKFYEKKPIPVSLDDAKMYINEYFKLFSIKVSKDIKRALEQLSKKLTGKWEHVYYQKLKKGFWVLILNKGEVITLFDTVRRLVNVNVDEDYGTVDNALEILRIIAKINEIEIDYLQPYRGVIYVKMMKKLGNNKIINVQKLLAEHPSIINAVNEDGILKVYSELYYQGKLNLKEKAQLILEIAKIA